MKKCIFVEQNEKFHKYGKILREILKTLLKKIKKCRKKFNYLVFRQKRAELSKKHIC